MSYHLGSLNFQITPPSNLTIGPGGTATNPGTSTVRYSPVPSPSTLITNTNVSARIAPIDIARSEQTVAPVIDPLHPPPFVSTVDTGQANQIGLVTPDQATAGQQVADARNRAEVAVRALLTQMGIIGIDGLLALRALLTGVLQEGMSAPVEAAVRSTITLLTQAGGTPPAQAGTDVAKLASWYNAVVPAMQNAASQYAASQQTAADQQAAADGSTPPTARASMLSRPVLIGGVVVAGVIGLLWWRSRRH